MRSRILTAGTVILFWAFHPIAVIAQMEEDPTKSKGDALVEDSFLFEQLDLNLVGLETVKACVEKGDFAEAKEAYLEYRRNQSPAQWQLPAISSDLERREDPKAEEICRNLIRNTEYTFSPKISEVFMGEEFDWTHNPMPESDPAFTKEWTWCVISRMGFWNHLADGYRKTGNEKYAEKWIWLLRDFAKDHPYTKNAPKPADELLWRGIDSGLRMNSPWPNAYFTFRDSPSMTAEDHWLFIKLLYTHVIRFKEALEDHPERTGNHVNIECRGLYNIGALFTEFREAGEWRKLATDRLINEYNIGVTPEGMQSELSPSYHFVALRTYLQVLALAKLNGLSIPEEFRKKILNMYRAPVMVMDQSGLLVSTNDSTPVNARQMAKLGLKIGDDPVLEWAASGGTTGKPLSYSTALEYAGFYAMRGGWAPEDVYLFFRGGPIGSGHIENDMLQIVLKAWEKTLLIEPGKYPYDKSEWRRYAINSSAHNTIIVDGKWQNRSATKLPIDKPVTNPWVTTPLFDFVSATYDQGYQKNDYYAVQYRPQKWVGELDLSVSHTRRVLFLRPYYALIIDTLDGTGKHVFDAHFHLGAPRAILDTKTQNVFSERPDNVQVGLYPLDRANLKVEIIEGQEEPMLGWAWAEHATEFSGDAGGKKSNPDHKMAAEKYPIPTVRFRKEQAAPAVFATFVYPYQGKAPEVTAKPLVLSPSDKLWMGFGLHTPNESIETLIAGKGEAAGRVSFTSRMVGKIETTAAGLVLRKPATAGEPIIGGWKISYYQSEFLRFSTSQPAILNFVFDKASRTLSVVNKGTSAVEIRISFPFTKRVELPPEIAMNIAPQFVDKLTNMDFLRPFMAK